MKQWGMYEDGYSWHCIPLDDEKDHLISKDCGCNPSYSEGKGGWPIYTHPSWDRREILERIENAILP